MINNYFLLFKNRQFMFFMLARVVLDIGKKLSWVSLTWFVYQVTGSALSVGTVISVATFSPLLSTIFVGGLLDQYNRRSIMMLDNVLRGLILFLIPLMYWMDRLTLSIIIVVVFINGLLSSVTSVGSQSILPSFVRKEQLELANAMSNMTAQGGYLLGPAIGGLSTAYFGAPMTILFNVLCFFLATLLYAMIPSSAYHQGVTRSSNTPVISEKLRNFYRDTKEGFRYVFHYKPIIIIAIITFFFNIAYAPLEAVLPIFVKDILQSGPDTLGLMWTLFAVGSFIGSFLWVQIKKEMTYSSSLGAVIFLWGLVPVFFSFLPYKYFILGLMLVGGMVYAPYNIVSPTLQQKLIPNELRGRVLGVLSLISGIGFPVGVYLGGWLGDGIGVINTILVAGILTLTLGVCVFFSSTLRFIEPPLTENKSTTAKISRNPHQL